MRLLRSRSLRSFGAVAVLLATTLVSAPPAQAADFPDHVFGGGLSFSQRAHLLAIARDTWRFFEKDIDPRTNLPMDNLGPGNTRGEYTSAANIGVYLWSVVAAKDMHIIDRRKAASLISATLTEVSTMKRSYGFLYQWYDTATGEAILNPGDVPCSTRTTPAKDNCSFLSAVDNGWYASGLIVARQALPEVRPLVDPLVDALDFSIFYDARPQTDCNVNASLPGSPPTGQQYGGYYVGQGPADYHNGALYSDPRISMYIGMGLHQMPGDVWWRTWRTLPPQQCSTDPDFSWQGQQPTGYWQTIRDPQSGKKFRVWEGKYTYPGTSLDYMPTFGGGMFEGLMANEVIPETFWGRGSFGRADVRTVQVQIKYATQSLHYPVWGLSPSSTADYATFGVEGLTLPVGQRLAQCVTCATETTVTPHASFLALGVLPQAAYANISKLRQLYPGVYTHDGGFYDAVNPMTGAIGHRRLVLDQSMIMAGLDNALNFNALPRYFDRDRVAWAARLYLVVETLAVRR